jgi:hypothetical protein
MSVKPQQNHDTRRPQTLFPAIIPFLRRRHRLLMVGNQLLQLYAAVCQALERLRAVEAEKHKMEIDANADKVRIQQQFR